MALVSVPESGALSRRHAGLLASSGGLLTPHVVPSRSAPQTHDNSCGPASSLYPPSSILPPQAPAALHRGPRMDEQNTSPFQPCPPTWHAHCTWAPRPIPMFDFAWRRQSLGCSSAARWGELPWSCWSLSFWAHAAGLGIAAPCALFTLTHCSGCASVRGQRHK